MSINDPDSSLLQPPETDLTIPDDFSDQPEWRVVAKNKRINKTWEELIRQAPENCQRCYRHLARQPLQRLPGRVFPLKGKKYKGAWEFEVTSGDRVFYVPDIDRQIVVVYYAGKHPNVAPFP
jgi:hypothetical protein